MTLFPGSLLMSLAMALLFPASLTFMSGYLHIICWVYYEVYFVCHQVTAHGGPQPESTIDFSLDNVTVAQVSSSGLIEALELGTTTLHGRAVGMDPHSGMVVYSQVTLSLQGTVYVA